MMKKWNLCGKKTAKLKLEENMISIKWAQEADAEEITKIKKYVDKQIVKRIWYIII